MDDAADASRYRAYSGSFDNGDCQPDLHMETRRFASRSKYIKRLLTVVAAMILR